MCEHALFVCNRLYLFVLRIVSVCICALCVCVHECARVRICGFLECVWAVSAFYLLPRVESGNGDREKGKTLLSNLAS